MTITGATEDKAACRVIAGEKQACIAGWGTNLRTMRPRFAGGAVDLRPEEIVRLEGDRVVLLDQRRLPDEEVEVECRSAEEVA